MVGPAPSFRARLRLDVHAAYPAGARGLRLRLPADRFRRTGRRAGYFLIAGGSAACDLRQDVHLAVGADLLEQGVLVDLPVDGDGRALLEVRGQRREFL